MSRTTLTAGAIALCLAAASCAAVGGRAGSPRQLAVVPASSSSRVSVARANSTDDLLSYCVPSLVWAPLFRQAARGVAQLVEDVRLARALQEQAGPELDVQLAEAVVGVAAGRGMKPFVAPPADDLGCDTSPWPAPAPTAESVNVAVVRVAFVGEEGAPLGLTIGVRGVHRGPGDRCAERILFLASEVERPLSAWSPDALQAELRALIGAAAPRIVAELVDPPGAREATR